MAKKEIDWEAVEQDYRTGIKTLRQIGEDYGCSHVAVKKRADRDGWVRDLSAKIREAAEAKVTKSQVTAAVTKAASESERVLIETNAQMLAEKLIDQREDVRRARRIVQKLFAEVEDECDNREDFAALGELLANPDDKGRDRLNELYRAAISLPERVRSAKALSDALKVLVELERRVLKLDEFTPGDGQKRVARVELVALT